MICYETNKGKDDCPITGIQFVKKAEADTFIANKKAGSTGGNSTTGAKETWTKTDFDEEQVIVFTKDTNSLPLMGTKLEYEPCMNPTRTSVSPG